MLYLTTRDDRYAHTAHKTLCADAAPDGGQFVPYKLPCLEKKQLDAIAQKSFGEAVAQILNLFFAVHLTAWDVDLRIGRTPVRIATMNRKIAVAELWRNPGSGVEHLINELYRCIATSSEHSAVPTRWARIAIRIAILFGIYAQMQYENCGDTVLDISVNTQDMTELVSAWYARAMGLPLGQIICCCDAGEVFWDLLHSGVLNTRGICDMQFSGAEHLVCEILGYAEALKLVCAGNNGSTFSMSEEDLIVFSAGIYPVAVGPDRAESVIASMHRSFGYSIDAAAAVTYGGLQDYRAQTGESRLTLLLSQFAPVNAESV